MIIVENEKGESEERTDKEFIPLLSFPTGLLLFVCVEKEKVINKYNCERSM
jgi:hypothetical protein